MFAYGDKLEAAKQTGNGWKIQLVSIKTPLIIVQIVQIAMFDCQMVIHVWLKQMKLEQLKHKL